MKLTDMKFAEVAVELLAGEALHAYTEPFDVPWEVQD